MQTSEILRRAIKYETGLIRNYQQYARMVSNQEIAELFQRMAAEKADLVIELTNCIRKYCPT